MYSRIFLEKKYGSSKVDSPSPYLAILLCGYERATRDVLSQDSKSYQPAFQESFSDMQDQPQPVMGWMEAIVYPPDDDSLTPLPRSSKVTEYSNPPQRYFYAPSPGLRILGHSIPKLSHQEASTLMKVFSKALAPLVNQFFADFCLPHLAESPRIGYAPADFASVHLLPWIEIVRQTHALALIGFHIDLSWETSKLEETVKHTLPSQSKGCLAQWVEAFVEVMRNNSHKPSEAIFSGIAPFTNENLKQVEATGSYYFDLCHHQIADVYQVQTTKKQLLQAPNEQLVAV